MLVRQRSWVVLILQMILIVFSATLAWLLRFDFRLPYSEVLLRALPVLLLMRMAAIKRFGLLHGYWRYSGISDAADVLQAVGLGSLGFILAEHWVLGVRAFPFSVYLIEAGMTAALLGGIRFLSRAVMQGVEAGKADGPRTRALIVGAGAAGAMLVRELKTHGIYQAVAFVDDDPNKRGVKFCGLPVLGEIHEIPEIVPENQIDEILIAIPSASGKEMRRITEVCQATRCRFRTIPGLGEFIEGKASVEQLREVNLEDLLGRDPIKLDLAQVKQFLEGRVVMVTGAAGSIGSELCRQIAKSSPKLLVCLDQAETPLFNLQQEIKRLENCKLQFVIADITDSARMRQVIRQCRVQAIFHAAAYKHVPLMEDNVPEALKNNVFGLQSLVEIAEECGCEDFLLVSSDKAVNPTSFMGCTKRVCELLLASRSLLKMRCVSVRFGNALGSQGSVVPLFREQIRQRRTITITHPEMTRYFMTIPEAVSLILQAFVIGRSGDILVLDMGDPIRILDMARTLVRTSGFTEDEVRIVYTGLRPGEKLAEELFYPFEELKQTAVAKVLRTSTARQTSRDIQQDLAQLALSMLNPNSDMIRHQIKKIVPQYRWDYKPTEEELGAVSFVGTKKGQESEPLSFRRGAD